MISEVLRISGENLIDGINSLISQIYGYNQLVDELEQALIPCDNIIENQAFIKKGYNKYLDELYGLKYNSNQKINRIMSRSN